MTAVSLEKILAGSVETSDAQLVINMPNEKLPIGKHVFQLTVADNSGNASQPAQVTVIIVDTQAPTAVLDLLDAQGRTVTNGQISFGADFILNGKRSTDIGGTITRFVWEVLPQ